MGAHAQKWRQPTQLTPRDERVLAWELRSLHPYAWALRSLEPAPAGSPYGKPNRTLLQSVEAGLRRVTRDCS